MCWGLLDVEAGWSSQDPFCLVPEEFQAQLDVKEMKDLTLALASINLDFFLIELHEMILVALSNLQPEYE